MVKKLPKFGYCALTADFLHVGHTRFIKTCASKCKILNVGIMSDECVKQYKGKLPILSQHVRMELVSEVKGVQWVYLQNSFEFKDERWLMELKKFQKKNFVIFDGEEHNRKGADILIPRTTGISSSLFKEKNEGTDLSKFPL